MSCRENCNNHTSECFHLLATPLHRLAIWHVESSEARIWRHHRWEQVEFVDPGLLLEEGCCPVLWMLKHTEIDGMKNVGCHNSRRRDAFHIPEDAFWGSNCSISQIMSCFPPLSLISLTCECHLLEVYPIVSVLPWWWIPFSKGPFWCFSHRAMGMLEWVQVNVFEVVIRPCTDDRITLPHPIIRATHKLSRVEMRAERTKNMVEDCPQTPSMVSSLSLHIRHSFMFFKVIFWQNGKKGNMDACQIRRLWSNHWVEVSETQISWPFLLVARTVWKLCLVWTVKYRDNRSSKRPP